MLWSNNVDDWNYRKEVKQNGVTYVQTHERIDISLTEKNKIICTYAIGENNIASQEFNFSVLSSNLSYDFYYEDRKNNYLKIKFSYLSSTKVTNIYVDGTSEQYKNGSINFDFENIFMYRRTYSSGEIDKGRFYDADISTGSTYDFSGGLLYKAVEDNTSCFIGRVWSKNVIEVELDPTINPIDPKTIGYVETEKDISAYYNYSFYEQTTEEYIYKRVKGKYNFQLYIGRETGPSGDGVYPFYIVVKTFIGKYLIKELKYNITSSGNISYIVSTNEIKQISNRNYLTNNFLLALIKESPADGSDGDFLVTINKNKEKYQFPNAFISKIINHKIATLIKNDTSHNINEDAFKINATYYSGGDINCIVNGSDPILLAEILTLEEADEAYDKYINPDYYNSKYIKEEEENIINTYIEGNVNFKVYVNKGAYIGLNISQIKWIFDRYIGTTYIDSIEIHVDNDYGAKQYYDIKNKKKNNSIYSQTESTDLNNLYISLTSNGNNFCLIIQPCFKNDDTQKTKLLYSQEYINKYNGTTIKDYEARNDAVTNRTLWFGDNFVDTALSEINSTNDRVYLADILTKFSMRELISTENKVIEEEKNIIREINFPKKNVSTLIGSYVERIIDKDGNDLQSLLDNKLENNNIEFTGYISGERNPSGSIGSFSSNFGKNNIASGNMSHAEGYGTTASGYNSHSEGNATTASGSTSHAEGYNTKASGYISHAEGGDTEATASFSHAEGYGTKSNAIESHAEGYGSIVNSVSSYGHAEGDYTKVGKDITEYQQVDGVWKYVVTQQLSGTGAHAEGGYTEAIGSFTHTEGYGTKTYTETINSDNSKTYISGYASHAEGNYTISSGNSSHAEGNYTKSTYNSSHSEGNYTIANNFASHAEGDTSTASGESSHAEGYHTIASGSYSHAEGDQTKATNYASHAEGYSTEATESYSHAEGKLTKATGAYSHAEGEETTASAYGAHAGGYKTKAQSKYSTAIGMNCNTSTSKEGQVVLGYNNTVVNDAIVVIGNGSSSGSTSNALYIDENGNIHSNQLKSNNTLFEFQIENNVYGYKKDGEFKAFGNEVAAVGNEDSELESITVDGTTYTISTAASASDYNSLKNLPQINGITLKDNKSFSDLGLSVSESGDSTTTIKYITIDGAEYRISGSGESGGTTDYLDLDNKPSIEGVTLVGNATFEELGIINFSGSYSDLTDVPSSFEPEYHTHYKSEITDFEHTHVKADIEDFYHEHTKSDITDFEHSHTKDDIEDFAHTHVISDIEDIYDFIIPNPEDLSQTAIDLTGLRINNVDYKVSAGGSSITFATKEQILALFED